MEPSQEDIDKWSKDPNKWKLGLFYFNKIDNRTFVSKPKESMGVTLNFANPKSYLAIIFMIGFFGFIFFMISNKH